MENKQLPTKIVSITGAGGQIGYVLCSLIADGRLLGPKYRVFLKMIEIAAVVPSLEGAINEIEDQASPYFAGALATSDPAEGFKDADIILLVGSKPRLQGMERSDLLRDNAKIFAEQGKVINEVASPNAKILVVGNPVNTNALILANHAPKIPKKNITSLTRLDYNRAIGVLANEFKVAGNNISNPIVWGNHSASLCLDLNNVTIDGKKPEELAGKISTMEKTVQQRGAEILKKRGKSSCFSAAIAICDHINDWVNGTQDGRYVSMGVFVEGENSYGVPSTLNFSCPVQCQGGEWKLASGLNLTEDIKQKIAANIKELEEEKKIAESIDN
jgi:malate dehydrogenase